MGNYGELPDDYQNLCYIYFLRPKTIYDTVMKLLPEKKYHIESAIAPKMVGNVVANMC